VLVATGTLTEVGAQEIIAAIMMLYGHLGSIFSKVKADKALKQES